MTEDRHAFSTQPSVHAARARVRLMPLAVIRAALGEGAAAANGDGDVHMQAPVGS